MNNVIQGIVGEVEEREQLDELTRRVDVICNLYVKLKKETVEDINGLENTIDDMAEFLLRLQSRIGGVEQHQYAYRDRLNHFGDRLEKLERKVSTAIVVEDE